VTDWQIDTPRTLDFAGVREVRVRVVSGDVSVTGTSASDAHLEVTDIEGVLVVEYADGVLTVSQPGLTWERLLDWWPTARSRVTLTLAVPRDCAAEIGVVKASALVSALAGPTRVRSVSGRLTLDGLEGETTARTVSGDVETVGLAGSLRFETVSGELTMAGGGRCEDVVAKSISGDIALDLVVAPGAIALDTVNGDIVIRLPADTAATVDATSRTGALSSAFDGLTHEETPGRRRLTGLLGPGGGRLRVTSVSGDVTLVRAQP
jgi:DUF4097 and DUF4098 domain-containing protein YvlB